MTKDVIKIGILSRPFASCAGANSVYSGERILNVRNEMCMGVCLCVPTIYVLKPKKQRTKSKIMRERERQRNPNVFVRITNKFRKTPKKEDNKMGKEKSGTSSNDS